LVIYEWFGIQHHGLGEFLFFLNYKKEATNKWLSSMMKFETLKQRIIGASSAKI
jgi:hypothetical protein